MAVFGWLRRAANRRTSPATIPRAAIAGALLVFGACGNTHVTQPAWEDLSGEYTYQITGSGGTCDEPLRSTGSGVTLVTQNQNWAEECFKRELCDGEHCTDGAVEGSVFTIEYSGIVQDGECLYLESVVVTLTQSADGSLSRRVENDLSYDAGDCTGKTLPCNRWQTAAQTKCAVPCYDSFCGGNVAATHASQP